MKTLIKHRKWYAVVLFMLTISIGNVWGATYTSVGTTLTDGKSYILVAGGSYAITASTPSTNWIGKTDVSGSISGTTLTTTATDIVWVATDEGSGQWSFKNGNNYITNGSGSTYRNMSCSTTKSNFTISNSKIYSTGSTAKWLQGLSSGFRMYNSTQSGAKETFVFYELDEGGSGDKTLSSIAVKTAPTKVKYVAGENFDPTGLVITATYSDNSTADINYSSSTFSFSPTTSTALTTSNTSVTITYGEKTTTQAINVYGVTVQMKDESGNTISSGPSASNTGATLTASSGGNYTFKQWELTNATLGSSASTASNNITSPTGAVTAVARFYDPITITYKANGQNFTTQTYAYNGTLAFPVSNPAGATYSCTGKTFVGWVGEANKNYSDEDDAPTYATAGGSVTAAETYYAVFATATAGADEDVTYSFLTSSDVTASTTAGWNITNTTSSYAATYGATWLRNNNASLPIFTFTPSVNVSNISIKVRQSNTTGSNTVACTVGGSSVGTTQSMSGTTQYDMEFTPGSASTGQIIITCTNGSGSGTGKGSFYVASITLTQEGTTYSNFETNCCTPLGQINGPIIFINVLWV